VWLATVKPLHACLFWFGAEIVLTPQQANEEMVSAIGEIIAECIKRFEAGKKINVVRMSRWLTRCCRPHALVPLVMQDRIKSDVCKGHNLRATPKLVELFAAIPDAYKKALQPYLLTKPIRSASGVRNHVAV